MIVMPAVSIATLSFWICSPTYLPDHNHAAREKEKGEHLNLSDIAS
jgi:hypothetical protein